MKHNRGWGFRGALLSAAAGFIVFSPTAQAQNVAGEAPGAALRRQLTELAANPNSVVELVETGRAALNAGDGTAALAFFTRAGELAPRDARVTAGLAAANVRLGRPETALTLFAEAVAIGAPEREIAGERGLAYDLLGQTARAQQDYLLSLRHREDAEVRRRMALSLAISGERESALRLLDPQVRQGDRAGSRARVMVLALSGDVRGAAAAANASLPPQAAQAITPFLSQLASLSPAQMASAANFGRVPSAGVSRMAGAAATATADPGALAFAGGGALTSPALRSRLPVTPVQSGAPRRRPGAVETAARNSATTPAVPTSRVLATSTSSQPVRTTSNALAAATSSISSLPAGFLQPHPHQPLRLARAPDMGPASSGDGQEEEESGSQPVEVARADDRPQPTAAAAPAATSAEPVLASAAPAASSLTLAQIEPPLQQPEARQQPQSQPLAATPAALEAPAQRTAAAANLAAWNTGDAPAVTSEQASPPASRPAFSEIVAVVSALPLESGTAPAASAPERPAATPAAGRSTPAAATRTATAATRTSTAARRPAPPTPQEAHPARIWVQLAVSPSRSAFTHDLNRMRRAAPELFRGKTAHVAPIGSNSTRLLVGPFPNDAAARSFVNGLKEKDITSLAWTSPAGTQVERFTTGR